MANADHTARARPKLHPRANSHTPLTTQASPSDLSDSDLSAALKIVSERAQALRRRSTEGRSV